MALQIAGAAAGEAPPADAREGEAREVEVLRTSLGGPEPELTVLLAAHDRMDVLPACLAALETQTAAGRFEVVVVDDGSTDGTAQWLRERELAVPHTFLRQRNGGAASARNAGLPHVRGRLVLFVNDDTIAAEDLVEGHLDAHRALAGQRAIVLGTFEQPEDARRNALVRMLERTDFVFAYARMDPAEPLGGSYLYTCNASVPVAAVRAVGGFDERFPWYTEDTELGLRLERAGYRVHFRPELRAEHHHVPTFAATERRQRGVAHAHARLFATHPWSLAEQAKLASNTVASMRGDLEENARLRADLERAVESLSSVEIAAIEGVDPAFAELAGRLDASLEETFRALNSLWWREGYCAGLREAGLSGFPELLARAPLALDGPGSRRTLVRATRETLPTLRAVAEAFLARADADEALVGWVDADDASLVVEVERALAPLAARAAQGEGAPTLALFADRVPAAGDPRVVAAFDAWLPLGAPQDDADARFAALAGVPTTDASAWLDDPERAPWPVEGDAPLRLVAHPRWNDAGDLDALCVACGPLVGDDRVALHLRLDPARDPALDAAVVTLQQAFARAHGEDASLAIVLEAAPFGEHDASRLGAAADARIALPGGRGTDLGAPALSGADAVSTWFAGAARGLDRPLARVTEAETA